MQFSAKDFWQKWAADSLKNEKISQWLTFKHKHDVLFLVVYFSMWYIASTLFKRRITSKYTKAFAKHTDTAAKKRSNEKKVSKITLAMYRCLTYGTGATIIFNMHNTLGFFALYGFYVFYDQDWIHTASEYPKLWASGIP